MAEIHSRAEGTQITLSTSEAKLLGKDIKAGLENLGAQATQAVYESCPEPMCGINQRNIVWGNGTVTIAFGCDRCPDTDTATVAAELTASYLGIRARYSE